MVSAMKVDNLGPVNEQKEAVERVVCNMRELTLSFQTTAIEQRLWVRGISDLIVVWTDVRVHSIEGERDREWGENG